MPVVEHVVSYRNGCQVMVAGLRLRDIGYVRGAHVQVSEPSGHSANVAWVFVVPNDEYATLACRNPAPPAWIQPGVGIRIQVEPPSDSGDRLGDSGQLAAWPTDVSRVVHPDPPTEEKVLPEPGRDLPPRVIYAVDVGAPTGGLAWARLAPHEEQIPRGSTDYNLFLQLLTADLSRRLPVALGFEAPLFLPVAANIGQLTLARQGEPAAWSVTPGANVTTIGIPLMALTLRKIQECVEPAPSISLDANTWLASGNLSPNLVLWEAFVWRDAHAREPNAAGLSDHVQDAATAVRAFMHWESAVPRQPSSITAHDPISTVGAALLWSGLADDIQLIHEQTLVLQPTQQLGFDVEVYERPGGDA
jgi:hypothetical protein